jgi:hypothetical protein
VARGAYGISYIHFHRAGGANILPINGPQVINAVISQSPGASFRPTQLGYPAGLTDPARFDPLLVVWEIPVGKGRRWGSSLAGRPSARSPRPTTRGRSNSV